MDKIVGHTILSFNDLAVRSDWSWDVFMAFHKLPPTSRGTGNSFTYSSVNTASASGTLPGADLNQASSCLKPFLDDLTGRGIAQDTLEVADTYTDHFYDYHGLLDIGWIISAPFFGQNLCMTSCASKSWR